MDRLCFLLISMLVGLAAVLRFWIGASDPLWVDELHTVWCTNEGLGQVSTRAAAGNQQPLYFWIVWMMRSCAGVVGQFDSPLAIRSVSLIAGTLMVVAVGYLVWEWTASRLVTFCACWLMAFETQYIFYSSEARPYALMQLLGVLQLILFWRWLERFRNAGQANSTLGIWQHGDWGLVITTAMLVHLHLTAIWLPLAELLFFFFLATHPIDRLSKSPSIFRKQACQSGLIIAAICSILSAPLIPHSLAIASERTNWEAVSSTFELISQVQDQVRWSIVIPLLGLFGWIVFNGFLNLRPTSNANAVLDLKTKAWLTLMGWSVPVAAVVLLDLSGIAPLAMARYTLVGTPALPVFAAICLAMVPFHWQRIGLGAFLLLGSWLANPWQAELFKNHAIPQLRFEDWMSPILEVNRSTEYQHFPVFLFANLIEDQNVKKNTDHYFQQYLTFPLTSLPPIDLSCRTVISHSTLDRQALEQQHLEHLRECQGVWIIIRGSDELAMEIISDIQSEFHRHYPGQVLKTSIASFDQSPWNDVKLILGKLE